MKKQAFYVIACLCAVCVFSCAWGQCTPTCPDPCACPPSPPAGQCVVLSEQQLRTALLGTNSCAGCSGGVANYDIVIPAGTQICVNQTIDLPSNAHLTINGTVTWTGATACGARVFSIINQSNVTIDGSGTINSIYVPCGGEQITGGCDQVCDDSQTWPSNARPIIAQGIRLQGASNITVEGLHFENLQSMVTAEQANSDHVTLTNLTGTGFAHNAIWLGANDGVRVDTATLTNIHITSVHNERPFRLYVSTLVMSNCSGFDVHSDKSGLWLAYGSGNEVNGFRSDEEVRFGPNFVTVGGDPANALLSNTHARNLDVTDVEAYLGIVDFTIEGLCGTQATVLHVGADAGANVVPRPMDNFYWANLNGVVDVGDHPQMNLPDIHEDPDLQCDGDVDENGAVDVDDFIAVILNWGACPSVGFCFADVADPPCGNGTVDVDDLIAVILGWGECPLGFEGGGIAGMPQNLQECMNMCNECCYAEYGECLQKCLQALCERGQTQYCD